MANPQGEPDMQIEYNPINQDGASLLEPEQALSRQIQTEITARTMEDSGQRSSNNLNQTSLKNNSLEKLKLVYGTREASPSFDHLINSTRTNQPGSRLRAVHQERKQINSDAEMIRNRVNQLQNLEKRMLKKIDKTRIEAEKVQKIKEQNFQRHEERMRAYQET